MPAPAVDKKLPAGTEIATLGGGCFWCTEAIYQKLKGVQFVVSGYSGGTVKNPTYEQVCSGTTGHAEVIQIAFDPKIVSFKEVLEVFFKTHDPTTLNRQGHDVGTQYRSAIFTHSPEQKKVASAVIEALTKSGAYDNKIVTEVTDFSIFYPAEDYHQNYFKLHGSQPYCAAVIKPKVDKFLKVFHDKVKSD